MTVSLVAAAGSTRGAARAGRAARFGGGSLLGASQRIAGGRQGGEDEGREDDTIIFHDMNFC